MSYRYWAAKLEQILPRFVFLGLYGTVALLKSLYIFYIRYGYLKSAYQWKSVSGRGDPIPWFSYPALDYLNSLDLSGLAVFEYGSGFSTLYWRRRAKSICAAEDNWQWAERVGRLLGEGAACVQLAASPTEYANLIHQSTENYDVIVIDGILRTDCAREAMVKLRDGGLIILDDADCHPAAAALLRDAGLIQVDFSGFGPINSYIKTTSFFLHRDFRKRVKCRKHVTSNPEDV